MVFNGAIVCTAKGCGQLFNEESSSPKKYSVKHTGYYPADATFLTYRADSSEAAPSINGKFDNDQPAKDLWEKPWLELSDPAGVSSDGTKLVPGWQEALEVEEQLPIKEAILLEKWYKEHEK